MKRDVPLVAPIFAPTLPRLNADYAVHRLRDAPDRAIPNSPGLRRVAKSSSPPAARARHAT
jgi:hypothetical protein